MKHLILFLVIYCGSTQAVTDKEYALLPPVFELDNYDRCMLLGDEALYCTIEFHMRPIDPDNPTDIWITMKEVSDNPKNYRHDNLRHGICVPFTCPDINRTKINDEFKEELAKCYNKKYVDMGIEGTIAKMSCQTSESEPTDWLDNITLYGLIAYFLFVVYASFYEGTARYYSKTEYDKKIKTPVGTFLAAFSVPKNWYRLKSIKDTPDVRALRGIQGVRFYNMICVILAHSAMSAMVGPVENTKYPETVTDKVSNMFMSSGSYAVQTFFMISSWLLTYQMLVAFENKKEIKPGALVWVFINRYIRLTPPMALMILLHSTWLRHMGNGPFWDHIVGEEYRNCRANGWTNILYINNYVNAQNMCFSESWYLAADMHSFILVLFLLYFIKKNPQRVWFYIIATLLTTQSIFMAHIYFGGYPVTVRTYAEQFYLLNVLQQNLWLTLVSSTHSNLCGAIVGTAFGYIFYKYRNVEIEIKKIHHVMWWLIFLVCCIGIIAIPGMYIHSKNYVHHHWFVLPYVGFGRTIFAFGMGVMILGVSRGIGWAFKWVLEWDPIYIVGRLTYSSFLVHYIIAMSLVGHNRSPEYITDINIAIGVVSLTSLSVMAALILTLWVELPISSLQSIYLAKKNTSEQEDKIKTK